MHNNWNTISLDVYFQIKETNKESLPLIDKIIYIYDLLEYKSMDDPYWDELDSDDFIGVIEKVKWINTEPKPSKGINYPINKIHFGQFIDLVESYRKEDWKMFLSVFDVNINDCSVGTYTYYKELFYNYYLKITETYKIIYPKGEEDVLPSLDTSEESMSYKDKVQQKRLLEREKTKQTYNWINLVYVLADGDITKYDKILSTSNILVHSWLSLMIMKNKNMM